MRNDTAAHLSEPLMKQVCHCPNKGNQEAADLCEELLRYPKQVKTYVQSLTT